MPPGHLGLVVLIPDVRAPYAQVFEQMLEGVRRADGGELRTVRVPAGRGAAVDVAAAPGTAVIALGQGALEAARPLRGQMPVVVGAVLGKPADNGELAGISLDPHPGRLFGELRTLLPRARRVWVVAHPERSAWLLGYAEHAARQAGIELRVQAARDLKSATREYQVVSASADPDMDVLWLLRDPQVLDERSVLPHVLETAWDRHLPVISSSLDHVGRGALFALYPDNVRMGQRLGTLAVALAEGRARPDGIRPLEDLRIAVNRRTASHLGVNLAARGGGYDLTLPAAP